MRGVKGPNKCMLPNCQNKYYGKGLCSSHYSKARTKGLVGNIGKKECGADGCNARAVVMDYCRKHYTRWYRHKDVHYVTPRNEIVFKRRKLNFALRSQ